MPGGVMMVMVMVMAGSFTTPGLQDLVPLRATQGWGGTVTGGRVGPASKQWLQ